MNEPERIQVYFRDEFIEVMDWFWPRHGFSTRMEFINTAIEEWLHGKQMDL